MREIKFRAWDKKTKTIREVAEIKFDGKYYNVRLIFPTATSPRNWHLRIFDEVELMQFTGLYDKNGKEIYEGDVVDYGNGRFRPVEFIDGCFCICGITSMPTLMTKFAIVGNIYENSELLNERK